MSTGQIVNNQNYDVREGANILILDYLDFDKGMYGVKIKNDKGQTNRKLIIQ